MSFQTMTHEDQVAQAPRIVNLTKILFVCNFLGTLTYLGLAIFTNSLLFVAFTVMSVVLFIPMSFTLYLAIKARVQAAMITQSSSAFVISIACMVLAPDVQVLWMLLTLMPITVVIPYLGRQALRLTAVLATLMAFVIIGLGFIMNGEVPNRIFPVISPTVRNIMIAGIAPGLYAVILLPLLLFHGRLLEAIRKFQETNASLTEARANLESQVAERTRDLRVALVEVQTRSAEQERLLIENEQQRETIRELSMPVLPFTKNALVMPLVGALDSSRLMMLQDRALQAIQDSSARYVLLDITGVPVVDSQVAQGLIGVVQSARLLGAEVLLVGIRPEVAQAIVGLGLDLRGMRTFSDVQTALRKIPTS